jgi:hypothetical protein
MIIEVAIEVLKEILNLGHIFWNLRGGSKGPFFRVRKNGLVS